MSLINKMLQDLDARRAAHGVGTRLPNDVRPLPAARPSRLPLILGGVFVLVLAGGLAVYQRAAGPSAAPPAPLPPARVEVPAAPPEPPVSAPVLTAPAPSVAAPAAETPPPADGGLRLAEAISTSAPTNAAPRPLAASARVDPPQEGGKRPARVGSKPDVAETQLATPAVPAQPALSARGASIERSDALNSPRERAESDYRQAIAAVNQGRIADAVEVLRNALRHDGWHVASRQLLVNLLLEAKRTDEAIQVLKDGLRGQPAQIAWAMSLARLQLELGDLAGGWQTLDESLPAADGSADYQGFAANVLQRLGRHREAAERYRAATRLAPGDGRWWLGLGLALEAEGAAGEAREAYLRARQSGNLSAALQTLVEQKLR